MLDSGFNPPLLSIAPWATQEMIIGLLSLATAVLGPAGAWEIWKIRKRKKLSAQEAEGAEKAAADKVVNSASLIIDEWQDMVAMLRTQHKLENERRDAQHREELAQIEARHSKEIARMDLRLTVQSERNDRMETKVSRLEKESVKQSHTIFRLRAAVATIQQWWDGIVAEWDRIRQLPNPPAFPHIKLEE